MSRANDDASHRILESSWTVDPPPTIVAFISITIDHSSSMYDVQKELLPSSSSFEHDFGDQPTVFEKACSPVVQLVLFVCLLQCVPQGRDVFANYTGTILQVTIIIPSHDPRS
jgi:hypothetical protein